MQYKKAPWEIYLRDTFKISKQTYLNMVEAFFKFPKESKVLGPGLVTTVKQRCGKANMRSVIDKIMKIKKPTHPKIEKVIDANLLPVVSQRAGKPSYAALERENAKLKDEVRTLLLENSKLSKQIVKLKKAVGAVNILKDAFNLLPVAPRPGGNVTAPI